MAAKIYNAEFCQDSQKIGVHVSSNANETETLKITQYTAQNSTKNVKYFLFLIIFEINLEV